MTDSDTYFFQALDAGIGKPISGPPLHQFQALGVSLGLVRCMEGYTTATQPAHHVLLVEPQNKITPGIAPAALTAFSSSPLPSPLGVMA